MGKILAFAVAYELMLTEAKALVACTRHAANRWGS